MKRKTIFRHWKRETLEQVQIQGQQLEELQQTVVNLQSSIKKTIEQQQDQQQRMEKSIRDVFEINRNWQECKIDNGFNAHQQWIEALLKVANENQRKWEEDKIDNAFTANQQWQEALTKAEAENQRKWEEDKIDNAFTANQQWQEALTKEEAENQRKWEEDKIDNVLTAYQKWLEMLTKTQAENQCKWEEAKIDGAFTANQQWQEALISNLQQWFSEMINGKNLQILQYQKQIDDKLETIWRYLPFAADREESLEQRTFLLNTSLTIKKAKAEIEAISSRITKPLVIFVGDYVVFPNEAPRRYIEEIERNYQDFDFLVLSEVSWYSKEETAAKISSPFHIVPDIVGAHYLSDKIIVPLTEEDEKLIDTIEALKEASQKILKQNPEVSESYAKYVTVTTYRYYSDILPILSPRQIYIFNQFFYLHQIIEQVAKEQDVKIIYWEYGQVPGTFMIDKEGLFATGYPVKHVNSFTALPVQTKDLEDAKEILDFLRSSGLNRYEQSSDNELMNLLTNLKAKEKPIILYIDQIDGECGMFPESERLRTGASSYISSCEDGLFLLSEICKKNNWELIYKIHPIRSRVPETIPAGTHVIQKCNINMLIDNSDVIVTILSSVSFTASVRNRPVVTTGCNELYGKGCTYEAQSRDDVEKEIKEALSGGMSQHMQDMFLKYIAQMVKYYLFDDNRPRNIRYGKTINMIAKEGLI